MPRGTVTQVDPRSVDGTYERNAARNEIKAARELLIKAAGRADRLGKSETHQGLMGALAQVDDAKDVLR